MGCSWGSAKYFERRKTKFLAPSFTENIEYIQHLVLISRSPQPNEEIQGKKRQTVARGKQQENGVPGLAQNRRPPRVAAQHTRRQRILLIDHGRREGAAVGDVDVQGHKTHFPLRPARIRLARHHRADGRHCCVAAGHLARGPRRCARDGEQQLRHHAGRGLHGQGPNVFVIEFPQKKTYPV